jgi:hypothetical protein
MKVTVGLTLFAMAAASRITEDKRINKLWKTYTWTNSIVSGEEVPLTK